MWPSPGPWPPCRCWRSSACLCEARGLFLATKSNKTDEEIDAARAIIQTLGGEDPFVMDYLLPETEIYHRVVTVFKSRPTPKAYPRK